MIKKDETCAYCKGGDFVSWSVPICKLAVSDVYLFREQSKLGRCTVAYQNHVSELVDLTDEERNAFFLDVARVAGTIHRVFRPDKINYGAFGDIGGHLHFHLVPKYKDGDEWGSMFTMDPKKTILKDEEYEDLVKKIKYELLKK